MFLLLSCVGDDSHGLVLRLPLRTSNDNKPSSCLVFNQTTTHTHQPGTLTCRILESWRAVGVAGRHTRQVFWYLFSFFV